MTDYAKASWAPTRKWWAALVTAIAAVVVAYLEAGEWTTTLSVMAVGVVTQAIVTYLLPNQASATGTGVPAATH